VFSSFLLILNILYPTSPTTFTIWHFSGNGKNSLEQIIINAEKKEHNEIVNSKNSSGLWLKH
jgi:hypothetical protein